MIPYGRHQISEQDVNAVTRVLNGDWLTTGPLVEEFEIEISKLVEAPSISVSSGTAALHAAYAAIGIKPGDEVITPPLTFIATQATAALFGANIVFCDIQPDTGNIDPGKLEELITPKTKAVVAVDYAGHPAELSELRVITEKYGIYLIEDAAHSFGSKYRERPVGSIADLTTFSFFPTKNMTTGEGGAVSSLNPELLNRAKLFSRQGLVRDPKQMDYPTEGPWHQEVHTFGVNYRLPDILCALGISQIKRVQDFKDKRTEIFNQYSVLLSDFAEILPVRRSYVDPMWHLFPIQVPKTRRRKIFENLRASGVGVQVNYLPAHLHPVFRKKGFTEGNFPLAETFYQKEISLPMHAGLTETDIEFISSKLTESLNNL
jgi:dTDP-4-amino-4,6-dideoxygalactose transaminase